MFLRLARWLIICGGTSNSPFSTTQKGTISQLERGIVPLYFIISYQADNDWLPLAAWLRGTVRKNVVPFPG